METLTMKKTTFAAVSAFLAFLLIAVPIASATTYTEFTSYAPLANLPGSGHSVVVSEVRFSAYGTEKDNQFGANAFSIQLNAQRTWSCGTLNLGTCELGYQSVASYGDSLFYTTPEIWFTCLSIFCSNSYTPVLQWSGNPVEDPTAISASSLTSYTVLLGINTGTSNDLVTVTSCNVQITINELSMYVGILNMNTCKMQWSSNISFPATNDGNSYQSTGLSTIQTGVLGFGGGSEAIFTKTVIGMEMVELGCYETGCTYSYSSGAPGGSLALSTEYSNAVFWISNDSGGHHIYVCQESTDESVCAT